MIEHYGTNKPKTAYYGRKIVNAVFIDDSMKLEFEDGAEVKISDEGQLCCESRYMTCDDDPKSLIGQTLKSIEVKDVEASGDEDEYGYIHEVAFLEIQGDKSSINFSTHNENNGYYGGFTLVIEETKKQREAKMFEAMILEKGDSTSEKHLKLFKKTESVVDAIYYAKGLIEDLFLKNDPEYKVFYVMVKEIETDKLVYLAEYQDGNFIQETSLSALRPLRERNTSCAVRPRSFSPGAK